MKITYKNKGIEKICTNASAAERKHGRRMAEVIHTRIDQIAAVDTVEMMIQYHIGRCQIGMASMRLTLYIHIDLCLRSMAKISKLRILKKLLTIIKSIS